MARLNVPFYQASGYNFTPGRQGRSIKYFTVHHSAGWEDTLRYLWQNPNRGGSSHFWVGNKPGQIEQYVDTDDTAWANGNWISNTESITCETRGDWRNGYYDQTTLDNLGELMYQSLKLYPNMSLTFHQDVSDVYTLCPADLKHAGYALNKWNEALARIAADNAPEPTPAPVTQMKVTDIPNKIVVMKINGNLWDLSFRKWGDEKSVKVLEKGTTIEASAIVEHPLGGKYYLSEYSFSKGIMNGVNVEDVEDYNPPKPEPAPTPVEVVPVPPETDTPVEDPTLPPIAPGVDNPIVEETPKDEHEPIIDAPTQSGSKSPLMRFVTWLLKLLSDFWNLNKRK